MVMISAVCYIKYNTLRLGGLVKALTAVSQRAESLPADQRERMEFLLFEVKETENRTLITAWEDFYRDYDVLLKGEIVPDTSAYLSEERLIAVPCGRKMMERIPYILLILGLAGALLYPALNLVFPELLPGREVGFSIGISLLAWRRLR
jgi:hypothetical protein